MSKRKVLISFVGTGAPVFDDKRKIVINQNNNTREYKLAEYSFDNGKTRHNTSFVSKAIIDEYAIDSAILVGTVKSMWEEVYNVYSNNCPNEPIYWDIVNSIDTKNANSPLELVHKAEIEKVLPGESRILLINYGINEEQLKSNSALILGIENLLNNDDELILDVTHSFRSIPLYVMNLIFFLKNVSKKKINISHIYYGMIEVRGELGFAPVVELNSIMQINDWITGAHSFMEYGNGYLIADLMKELGDLSTANTITKFSEVLSLNHLDGITKEIKDISAIQKKDFGTIPNYIIPKVTQSFINLFKGCAKLSAKQYKIACWHYKHKNYSSSYLTLTEAIITYTCEEISSFDPQNRQYRDAAKEVLHNDKNNYGREVREYKTVSQSYKDVNSNRKAIAHSLESDDSSKNMIRILGENIELLKNIIK